MVTWVEPESDSLSSSSSVVRFPGRAALVSPTVSFPWQGMYERPAGVEIPEGYSVLPVVLAMVPPARSEEMAEEVVAERGESEVVAATEGLEGDEVEEVGRGGSGEGGSEARGVTGEVVEVCAEVEGTRVPAGVAVRDVAAGEGCEEVGVRGEVCQAAAGAGREEGVGGEGNEEEAEKQRQA